MTTLGITQDSRRYFRFFLFLFLFETSISKNGSIVFSYNIINYLRQETYVSAGVGLSVWLLWMDDIFKKHSK